MRFLRLFSPAILVFFAAASVTAQEAAPRPSESIVVSKPPRSDDNLIGENLQPEWTSYRRFPTTRVYVLPPFQVEFEQWWKGKFPRHGKPEHLFQSELEVGLPHRLQLDFYENVEHTASGATQHAGNQIEARWAFAPWGHIPLNPTLYGEWKFNGRDADAYEMRLLLGEQLAPRWHWGFNLFFEQQTGGARSTEWGFSQAVSFSASDSKFSVGLEMNFEHTTERGSRGDPSLEFLLGPSVQWRPTSRTHLDLVPLFGVTRDSPRVEVFIVFGLDLGRGTTATEARAPISTRAR